MTVNSSTHFRENHEDANFGMPDVLGLSGESDVVVDELTPGDEEDCHRVVVETLVLVKIVKRSRNEIGRQ